MKRKSEKGLINFERCARKCSTLSNPHFLRMKPDLPLYQQSEKVVQKLIDGLLEKLDDRISIIGEKESVQNLTKSCFSLFQNVYTLSSPENHEDEVAKITEDIEPERVSFDPICGFDKLKTYKNHGKKEQDNSIDSQNLTLQSKNSKMSAFSVFHNGKKQFLKAQLVPLELNIGEDERQEAQQTFYRERLFDLYMNFDADKKVLTNQKNPKNIDAIKTLPQEQCQYDYNGQKISISSAAKTNGQNKNIPSSVLKTSYRIMQDMQSKDAKPKRGGRDKKIPALERRYLVKQIITNKFLKIETARENTQNFFPKTNLQLGQDSIIKNLLQSKFKETKTKLKQIERPELYRQRMSRML